MPISDFRHTAAASHPIVGPFRAVLAFRFTLASLMVFVLGLGFASSSLVTAWASIRISRMRTCQANLKSLWQAQFDYAARETSSCCGPMRTPVGGDYWVELQRGRRPVVDSYERFFCPVAGERAVEGRTSYRGPRHNVNKMDDLDAIGADKEGNHGRGKGGHILKKTGEIFEASGNDPGWSLAQLTTRE